MDGQPPGGLFLHVRLDAEHLKDQYYLVISTPYQRRISGYIQVLTRPAGLIANIRFAAMADSRKVVLITG
jgi:hypothetical protein